MRNSIHTKRQQEGIEDWILVRFSTILFQRRELLCLPICFSALQVPSENGFTSKKKNLFQKEASSIYLG